MYVNSIRWMFTWSKQKVKKKFFFTSCELNLPFLGSSTDINTSFPSCSLSPPPSSFSLLDLGPLEKGEYPPFRISLWGNLGIIVVLIYPENTANPIFHLDVPELMPKLLCHRGSAAPWLCSLTFLLSFTYWALLKLLYALRFLGLRYTPNKYGVFFHMVNMLTHGTTNTQQQATVVVLCWYFTQCILFSG